MVDKALELEKGRAAVTDADVWEACYSANAWLTRGQIAAALGRKVTPSLIAKIEQMVKKGWLLRGYTVLPNGIKRFSYMAVEG